jgi:hypothetical protein
MNPLKQLYMKGEYFVLYSGVSDIGGKKKLFIKIFNLYEN